LRKPADGRAPSREVEIDVLRSLPAGALIAGVDEVGRGSLAGPVSVVIGRPGAFRLLESAPRVDVVVQPEQAVPVFYYRSWIKGDPGALTLERIKRPSPYEKQWLVIVVILLAVLAFHLLIELMKRL